MTKPNTNLKSLKKAQLIEIIESMGSAIAWEHDNAEEGARKAYREGADAHHIFNRHCGAQHCTVQLLAELVKVIDAQHHGLVDYNLTGKHLNWRGWVPGWVAGWIQNRRHEQPKK